MYPCGCCCVSGFIEFYEVAEFLAGLFMSCICSLIWIVEDIQDIFSEQVRSHSALNHDNFSAKQLVQLMGGKLGLPKLSSRAAEPCF